MKISAQLYTIREYTQTEKDIASSLKKISDIGFTNVQLSALGACRAEFLKEQLDKNGLTVCATHTPLDRILNDTDNVIREHLLLGIPYVGLGYHRFESVQDIDNFLAALLPKVAKMRDKGLYFLYHNHHHEFSDIGGTTAMQYILENTESEEFGILADCYWLQYAGVSPQKFISDNADRTKVIHLKDMSATIDGKHKFCEIYNGNMDYDGIIFAAQNVGVEYAAIEQDDCYGKDPFECLAASLNNIKVRTGL